MKTKNLKYHLQHEMMNMNYLMSHTQIASTQDSFQDVIKKQEALINFQHNYMLIISLMIY